MVRTILGLFIGTKERKKYGAEIKNKSLNIAITNYLKIIITFSINTSAIKWGLKSFNKMHVSVNPFTCEITL